MMEAYNSGVIEETTRYICIAHCYLSRADQANRLISRPCGVRDT